MYLTLTVVKAIILILKHATLLHLSHFLSPASALTHAELKYQKANIDLKIQQLLQVSTSSKEQFVKLLVRFIMVTNIGWFILAFTKTLSHYNLCIWTI